jgi:hypothetical protein
MATSTNIQRWASPSPLDRARHASAERKRASEEDVTKGYKTLFETVNPILEGLNARVGTVEARLTAQESHSRQEVEGLKAEISQLKEQNERLQTQLTRVEKVAESALSRANNHTHRINLKTRESHWNGCHGRPKVQPHEEPFVMPQLPHRYDIVLIPIIESERPT